MLRGHVDLVSPDVIAGWATNDESLDTPVDISIFVNGSKLVQITCDRLRADLREQGRFGDGRHGFRYQPDPPLSRSEPVRVEIRHAASGKTLGNGDVVLREGTASVSPDLRAALPEEFLILPAPETPRDLFTLLTLHDQREGLFTLLRQMDFADRTARQVCYGVLGDYARMMSTVPAKSAPDNWEPFLARDLTNDLMHSKEFQQNILPIFLDAFTEKRRLLFVHIPKCAGSDLSHHLVSRYASIDERWRSEQWTGKSQLWEELSAVVRRLPFSEAVFVRGHINLAYYVERRLIRPIDRAFTILRDPLEIAISQVNYILTRLLADAESGHFELDSLDWLRQLDVQVTPRDISPELLRGLGERALREQKIVLPNSMCHWLGGGDVETILARLETWGVEVTNTQQYRKWLLQRWGVDSTTRRNESFKFITHDMLGDKDLAYLRDISTEDMKLCTAIERLLAQTGGSSVRFGTAAH